MKQNDLSNKLRELPPLVAPTACPVCAGKVGHKSNTDGSDTVNLYCLNDECSAQSVGKIKRWIKSLDILGIGDNILAQMADKGVTTVADLYAITPGALATWTMGVGRVGTSRAASIVANIQAKRSLSIDEFLGSLGIPTIGKRKVQIIREAAVAKGNSEALNTLQGWREGDDLLNLAEACSIKNTAPIIVAWLRDNSDALDVLLEQVTVQSATVVPPVAVDFEIQSPIVAHVRKINAQLSGGFSPRLTFLLTGKFEIPKKELHAQITAAGHEFVEDFKPGVTHLVAANLDSTSSKAKKAEKQGIPILNVEQLLELIGA